jgi:osmotically-inducible protein OsmY
MRNAVDQQAARVARSTLRTARDGVRITNQTLESEEKLMAHEIKSRRGWTRIIRSVALGAAAMYLLDPDKGRRRRAIARDKARSLAIDTRNAVGATQRDVAHRIQGLRARARRLIRGRPAHDDLQLIERVRARMGRLVSHPHAIQVGAYQRRVTLSGPILAHEVQPLLESVRMVWGVADVEDRLVVYDHPESIPSLQGGAEPRTTRSEIMHENWPPALRAAALLSGTLMALYGMRQRSLTGCALTGLGIGLTARGATNRSIARLAERATRASTSEPRQAAQIASDQTSAWTQRPQSEPDAARNDQGMPAALH